MAEKKDRKVVLIAVAVIVVVIVALSAGLVIVQRVRQNRERHAVQFLVGRNPFNVNEIKSLAYRKEEESGALTYFFFHDKTLDKVTVKMDGVTLGDYDPNSPDWNLWQEKFEATRAEYFEEQDKGSSI